MYMYVCITDLFELSHNKREHNNILFTVLLFGLYTSWSEKYKENKIKTNYDVTQLYSTCTVPISVKHFSVTFLKAGTLRNYQ